MRDPITDWIVWVLHGIVGAVLGALLPFAFIGKRHHQINAVSDDIGLIVLGTALIGAGLGSRFGDQLWLHYSNSLFPADAPESSPLSRALSWTMVCVGALVIVAAKGPPILREWLGL